MSFHFGSASRGTHLWTSSVGNRFIFSLVLAALLAISTGCGPSSSPSGHSSQPVASPTPPPTVWDSLEGQIASDGHWDLTTSLQAFALAFGPLPGATAPSGTPGDLLSADFVLDDIFYHWPELSSSQQQAVQATFQALTPQIAHPLQREDVASAPSVSTKSALNKVASLGPCASASVTATPDLPNGSTYVGLVTQAISTICANLQRSLPANLPVTLSMVTPAFLQKIGKQSVTWDAVTICSNGSPISCAIVINLAQWQQYDYSAARQQFILTHEAFHLFERTLFSTSQQEHTHGKWLLEGEAQWVADVL